MRIARIVAALAIALVGCEHFQRASECRQLADAVNPDLAVLASSYAKISPISAEELRAAAKRYQGIAARLQPSRFKVAELSGLTGQMRDNLRAIARSCDRMALKLRQHESLADDVSRKDLEAQHQRHISLLTSIERVCQQ